MRNMNQRGEDAKRSIALLEYCLMQVARDSETGQIDVDIMSTGISTTQRSKIIVFKELLAELEGKIGKTIPVEDIAEAALHQPVSCSCRDAVQLLQCLRRGLSFQSYPQALPTIL